MARVPSKAKRMLPNPARLPQILAMASLQLDSIILQSVFAACTVAHALLLILFQFVKPTGKLCLFAMCQLGWADLFSTFLVLTT